MASRDGAASPTSPGQDDDNFPQYPRPGFAGPPSIISSRMTDIASEDEDEPAASKTATSKRRSGMASETLSRPGTARTGMSSMRHPFPQGQHLRKGLSGKRNSVGSSIAGSSTSGRPQSSASRSHVPSLTSHAFYHPMSSQRLQAQRGLVRPPTNMATQQALTADDSTDIVGDTTRHSVVSNPNPIAQVVQPTSDDGEGRPPPSRGTEMTEQETLDRITANTSPTQGHYPTASVSESLRPLQHKRTEGKNLTVRVNQGYKGSENLPTPMKSPRSFRSSFLLPSRGNSAHAGENRDIQGGEKLDSVASTPRISHAVPHGNDHGKADSLALRVGRNFEYFEGNTIFFLGGRFQNTKSRPVNIATGALTAVPALLFFVFSAPWLWSNVSPAIPLIFAYIFYICMSSFFHASGSDPGILPRNLHQFPPADENEDPLRLAPPTNDWVLIKSAQSSTAAMEVPTKYCKTCNIWRPPRAHHCRMCDNCIENADHHCVWLNNCMGRRNYRYFFAFVTSLFLMAIYVMASCLGQIVTYQHRENISFSAAVDHFRVPFALVFYSIVGLLYPAALMGYHLFLMARGETTREFLNSHKFLKKDRYRAFSQGNWFKNWIVVLCRPRPPTYYRFKQSYNQGDQRLAKERRPLQRRPDPKEGHEMQDVKPAQPGFQGPVALREPTPTSA